MENKSINARAKKAQPRIRKTKPERRQRERKQRIQRMVPERKMAEREADVQVSPLKGDIESLSASAQWELTSLHPGQYNTPYVDSNGLQSKLHTSVWSGYASGLSSTTAGTSLIITLCPIASVTDVSSGASSGIGAVNLANNATTLSIVELRGLGFNSVYGPTTYAARNIPYATTLNVSLKAPEATAAGVVFIGSVPVSSFIAATPSDLIRASIKTLDLKESTTFDIKHIVSDRALIHYRNLSGSALTTTGVISDEWVSYAIIPTGAFQSITNSNDIQFEYNLTAQSNVVWWPASGLTTLANVVAKNNPNIKPSTPKQEMFSKDAENHLNDPMPVNSQTVKSIIKSLLTAGSYVPMIGKYVSLAHTVLNATGVLEIHDPKPSLLSYDMQLTDLTFFMTSVQSRWYPCSGEIQVICEDLIADMQSAYDRISALIQQNKKYRDAYEGCTAVTKRQGHRLVITYLDEDGLLFNPDLPNLKKNRGNIDNSMSVSSHRIAK